MCDHKECKELAELLDNYDNQVNNLEESFPCYQEASNFVKLLEFVYSFFGGIDQFAKKETFVKDFINIVIEGLKLANKNFKTKAQQVDWNYEKEGDK
jgi:hypothetical protein